MDDLEKYTARMENFWTGDLICTREGCEAKKPLHNLPDPSA